MPKDNSRVTELLPGPEPARDMRPGGARVALEERLRRLPRGVDELRVPPEIGKAQQRLAALALAQDLARAAKLEIELGDFEAVVVLEDDLQALARGLGKPLPEEQDAVACA